MIIIRTYEGAVFFDYDGTLVDESENIYTPTPIVRKALEELKENGYLIGLCTGRSKCYIPKTGIHFDCYITTNGSYAEVNGHIIQNIPITPSPESLIAYTQQEDFVTFLEQQDYCYIIGMQTLLYQQYLNLFHLDSSYFLPYKSLEGLQPNKISILYENDRKLNTFIDKFGNDYEITPVRNSNTADICIKNINKATGVKAVANYLGLTSNRIYAFGDGENDYTMLKEAGYGITMRNHAKKLDELSLYVTKTVKEDGVAFALKKFRLIKS